MHISTQLVVRYIMGAGVEVKNELFLGFSVLVCWKIWKKGKLGELGDWDLMDWNNFSKVSGWFRGKTGLELFDSSIGLEVSFHEYVKNKFMCQ